MNDEWSSTVFSHFLGWQPKIYTSVDSPVVGCSGNSSLIMPYNGTIFFDDISQGVNLIQPETSISRTVKSETFDPEERIELDEYISNFKPFLTNGSQEGSIGYSIAILKKDGTWDLVEYSNTYIKGMPFRMSSWVFHNEISEYARTIDGYIRARITFKEKDMHGHKSYDSRFFVVDHLPQKVKLGYNYISSINPLDIGTNNAYAGECKIRLFFNNTEGVDRIVLEKLRSGARIPSKVEITDLKKGYFDTTIDKNTTFTAVSYNGNGSSRGEPLYIEYLSSEMQSLSDIEIEIVANNVNIVQSGQNCGLNYSIMPIIQNSSGGSVNGFTDGSIDISGLVPGYYVLKIENPETTEVRAFKLYKK